MAFYKIAEVKIANVTFSDRLEKEKTENSHIIDPEGSNYEFRRVEKYARLSWRFAPVKMLFYEAWRVITEESLLVACCGLDFSPMVYISKCKVEHGWRRKFVNWWAYRGLLERKLDGIYIYDEPKVHSWSVLHLFVFCIQWFQWRWTARSRGRGSDQLWKAALPVLLFRRLECITLLSNRVARTRCSCKPRIISRSLQLRESVTVVRLKI